MASDIDSRAVFRRRALAMGLPENVINSIKTNGISTMGRYAFSCAGQASSTDEQPLINMLQTILGAAPSLAVLASARRLHFEAHALSLDDLRYRLEFKQR